MFIWLKFFCLIKHVKNSIFVQIMLHGLIALNWVVRYTDGESIQKHLAAKDAKSANSKKHLDSLRYSPHKAFKLTVI